MAVRSDYIKKLMETKMAFEKQYKNVIEESMNNIISDNAKNGLRKLLKEADDEDSYSEEEVVDDAATVDNDETREDAEEFSDDIWNDLEQYKDADGEYDCRGMDNGTLVQVLKSMGPEDGIRVISNGDGTATLEVDGELIDGKEEFVVDFTNSSTEEVPEDNGDEDIDIVDNEETDDDNVEVDVTDGDDDEDIVIDTESEDGDDEDIDIDIVDDEEEDSDDESDEDEEEDEDLKESLTIELEDDEEDNDDDDEYFEFDVEDEEPINELMTSTQNNAAVRGTSMTHANTNQKGKVFRSSSEHGERVKGTGENSYSEKEGSSVNESLKFKRKMNKIYEENKQMKELIPAFQKKLMEAMTINASMGYIVKLLNENSTSIEEKKDITKRFASVNSIEEGKKLYETITKELKKVNKSNNMDNVFNSQLAESKKQKLLENNIYRSEKVNEALEFMNRLNNVK